MADDLQQEIKEEIKDEPQDDDCPVTEEVHNDDDDDNDNENDNAEMNEDDNSQDTKVPSNGIFIRLRGLPWDVTKQDIVDFLADANVVDGENGVYICKNRKDDKMTGEAFVNLESPEDEEEAFRHNKQDLGHRYIEIFKATADEVNFAMNRSKHRPSKVVKLRGLPFSSTFDTIEDFFKVEMMEPDSPAPHSPPPKADTTKKKYKNKAIWSVEQEDYLLRLWEENLEGLRTNRRNSFIIQQMCDAMKREGFYFSPKEITIKIHNMKGKYKRELKGFKESGLHFSDWIHFRRVQKLMETPNPLQSPPHNSIEDENVDDSLLAEQQDETLSESLSSPASPTVQPPPAKKLKRNLTFQSQLLKTIKRSQQILVEDVGRLRENDEKMVALAEQHNFLLSELARDTRELKNAFTDFLRRNSLK